MKAFSCRISFPKGDTRSLLLPIIFLALLSPSALPQIQKKKLPDGVEHWYIPEPPNSDSYLTKKLKEIYNIVLPAKNESPFGRSIAFLVGVSKYRYLSPQLPSVLNDVTDMRNFLLNKAGFDEVYLALDGIVNRDLLEEYVKTKLPAKMQKNDRLLFYYSGHGGDAGGSTGYMLFAEAQKGKFSGNDVLAISNLKDWSQELHIRHVLFILDSCSSGLGIAPKSDSVDNVNLLVQALSRNGSRLVLTAGTANEATYAENSEKTGHSFFTKALLSTFDSLSSNSQTGFITINELYAKVEEKMAALQVETGKSMKPGRWPLQEMDYRGTFVFLNLSANRAQLTQDEAQALGVPLVAKGDADTAASAALKLPPARYLPGQSEAVRMEERAKGIDITNHNHDIPWDEMRSMGYSFVVIRATQGKSFIDPKFGDYWDSAKRNGLLRGAYHVFVPSQTADEQADAFLRVAKLEPGDLPAIVDVGEVVGGASVSKSDLIFKLGQFLIQVKTATGRSPIIYTGQRYSIENFEALSSLKEYPLWIAQYGATDHPTVPPNWPTWTLWQFTDHAEIGNKIPLDANYFNGTLEDLKGFVGGGVESKQ